MKQITSIPLPDLLVYVAIAVVTLIGILKCILPVADTTRGLNRAVQSCREARTEMSGMMICSSGNA